MELGEADDSELLDELKALEEDIAGLNMGNGDKTAMHGVLIAALAVVVAAISRRR